METKFRKPAVDLTDLAVGIIVLGITVAIGSTLLIGIRDSRLTDLSTHTVNETFTGGTTAVSFSSHTTDTWVQGITDCWNSTNDSMSYPATNYTFSISDFGIGTLTGTGDLVNNDTTWNCNYTVYNTSRADWDLANNASIGLGEYGNWFKIIVIVGVAAVILSLIFMAFGRGSEGGSVAGSGGAIGGSY